MSNEDICREIVASNVGEAYFKCLTLVPDPNSHPHWTGPFFTALLLSLLVAIVIGILAD